MTAEKRIINENLEKLLGDEFLSKAINAEYVEARYKIGIGLITEINNPQKESEDGSLTFNIKKNGNNIPYIGSVHFGEEDVGEYVKYIIEKTKEKYNKAIKKL